MYVFDEFIIDRNSGESIRIVPSGRAGRCFATELVVNAITGLHNSTRCANSDGVDSGLAGETMTFNEMREKYSTGTCSEGGDIMRATFWLESEGNRDLREAERD